MTTNTIPEHILLSELISKLKDKDYYRVFAKTLLMTYTSPKTIPSDEYLVKEMFLFFIKDKQLNIFHKNKMTTLDYIDSEIDRRVSNTSSTPEETRDIIWKNEIYVKVKDLKKLYANKCIVLPNSLFINKDNNQ